MYFRKHGNFRHRACHDKRLVWREMVLNSLTQALDSHSIIRFNVLLLITNRKRELFFDAVCKAKPDKMN